MGAALPILLLLVGWGEKKSFWLGGGKNTALVGWGEEVVVEVLVKRK